MYQRLFPLLGALLLAACSGYGGGELRPGESSLDDVIAAMGWPAMRWENPDHSIQLSYPRGPAGYRSYMVFLDSNGRLQRVENVMDSSWFAKIQPGMNQEQVLRILGPSVPSWTVTFEARRELVWEWRYCDDWNNAARFDVLFDQDSRIVRSTLSWRELCHPDRPCYCSR